MCRRNTTDPLVRLFLERYRINLLKTPRELSACGDVYVKRDGRISAPGRLAEILDGDLVLPPARTEKLASLAGSLSERVDIDVGLGLLSAFLTAIGGAGVVDEVSAGYKRGKAHSVRFRLDGATRHFVDPLALGSAVDGRSFKAGHPWVHPGSSYFVIAAVVRTRSLSLTAEDESSNAVELGAGVLQAINAHGGRSAQKLETGEVRYEGAKALAVGVELYELREREGRFEMLTPKAALDLKQGRPAPAPPASFLGEDDSVLIDLTD